MGNGSVEGAITSFFEALNDLLLKTHLIFLLIFAENVKLLSLNIIKMITLKV